MRVEPKIRLIYGLTFAGILIWLGAIVSAPYLRFRGAGLAPYVYACFSPICHQIPARSFYLFGFPLAVCARCLGIYSGFAAGMVLYPSKRGFSSVRPPNTRLFFACSVPIVLDTAANYVHLWSTSNALRFAFGFLWGLILPFYFLTGIGDLVLRKKRKT